MIRSAIFSRNKVYRFVLEREWDDSLPKVMIIGLNPSTADAKIDDPTIRKCIRMSSNWGYGGMVMVNLFAYRATDPKDLYKAPKPVGSRNTWYIRNCLNKVETVVCAWGNHGNYLNRDHRVLKWLPPCKAININKTGIPAHPLYQKDNAPLINFNLS